MTAAPDWLPTLLTLSDHGGCWDTYVSAVYARFKADLIDKTLDFQGMRVGLRRNPMYHNREWAFWHIVQEGNVEENRIPNMRRCERIGWVRSIIQHASDPRIKKWENSRSGNHRILLWLVEQDFLVILAPRGKRYALLVTAYPTDRGHTCRKLQREYEENPKIDWPSL